MDLRHRTALTLGLLLAAGEADALSPRPPVLASNVAAADGKVVFCQPDESLTILDSETGAVLLRDTDAACTGWWRPTRYGPLLSTHWSRYRMLDVGQSIASGRMVTQWELGDEKLGGCRSSRVIDDQLVCARVQDFVVESRSLAGNTVRWSYEAPGAVMDIMPYEGRLLLQSGDDRLARHVSVVELDTGRPLFREGIVQDASFAVRSFDGERIVLSARPPAGSACTGAIVRTLTPAGVRMIGQDACGPDEHRGAAPQRARDRWDGKRISLRFPSGGWIEGVVKGGTTWFAYARDGHRGRELHELEESLLVERHGSGAATLEWLDAATGRSRWIYAYNPYRRPNREWDELLARTPKGTVPAGALRPGDEVPSEALRLAAYPGRVVFDPAPLRRPEPTPGPMS